MFEMGGVAITKSQFQFSFSTSSPIDGVQCIEINYHKEYNGNDNQ